MANLNPDFIILVAFLVINLIVGLRYRKSTQTLRDYAIGNKDFSTATLTATIVVSWIGGDNIFYMLGNTYQDGLYFIPAILGAAVCLLIIGQLTIRMGEFLKNISVAEAMGDLYGKTIQMITAISGILSVIGVVAIQFQVISQIISLIFNIQGPWVMVIAASIVIIYSSTGGIQAVTFTDVIQFFTLGTLIPILALVIWNNLKDPHQVVTVLQTNPNFSFKEVIGWNSKFLGSIAMLLWFLIPSMDPAIFQRISMSKDLIQAKNSFNYAGIINLLVNIFIIWLGILMLAEQPNLVPEKVFNHVITDYASVGLKGFIGIGIIALAMSTADSYLNVSAVLLTNDLIKPLGFNIKKETQLTKLFGFFIGGLALMLALYSNKILELLLIANSFYMPIVSVPLLLAIFGFRSSRRAVLIGMLAGAITVFIWGRYMAHTEINNVLPGIIANFFFFLGSHYALREKGGWVGIKDPEPLILARQERQRAWKARLKNIKQFRLSHYLQKNLPKQEYFFSLFGLYVIAATYAAFYTISDSVQAKYYDLYHFIYQSVLIATTAFLTYPIWPAILKSKRFIAWVWPLGIFYILFLVGSWLAIMSGFHEFQVMILLLNLVVAALLLSGPLVFLLALAGVALGAISFKLYAGVHSLPGDFGTLQFKVFYGLLLFSSFLIALFRYKQDKEQLESRNIYLNITQQEKDKELRKALKHQERFVARLATDCIEGFALLYQRGQDLQETLPKIKTTQDIADFMQQANALLEKQKEGSQYLAESIYHFKDYMRLDISFIKLDDLIQNILDQLDTLNLTPKPRLIVKHTTRHTAIQCDPTKLEKLLVNSITSIHHLKNNNTPITLMIADGNLTYDIPFIPNYNKQLAAWQFILTTNPETTVEEEAYMADEPITIYLSRDIEDLNRTENEQIVHAHYGVASWDSSEQGITQRYILPHELRKIRPELMDTTQMIVSETT